VEYSNNRVQQFDANGDFLASWGSLDALASIIPKAWPPTGRGTSRSRIAVTAAFSSSESEGGISPAPPACCFWVNDPPLGPSREHHAPEYVLLHQLKLRGTTDWQGKEAPAAARLENLPG
jgi:hypothetical protein